VLLDLASPLSIFVVGSIAASALSFTHFNVINNKINFSQQGAQVVSLGIPLESLFCEHLLQHILALLDGVVLETELLDVR